MARVPEQPSELPVPPLVHPVMYNWVFKRKDVKLDPAITEAMKIMNAHIEKQMTEEMSKCQDAKNQSADTNTNK